MLLVVGEMVGRGSRYGRRQQRCSGLRAAGPNPALGNLEVMVGTWELRGRESGGDRSSAPAPGGYARREVGRPGCREMQV